MVAQSPRFGYVTSSRHQLDERPLVLRGGPLDGSHRSVVTDVGARVFCGEGAWTVEEIYVVTAETVVDGGEERNVAVPAFA